MNQVNSFVWNIRLVLRTIKYVIKFFETNDIIEVHKAYHILPWGHSHYSYCLTFKGIKNHVNGQGLQKVQIRKTIFINFLRNSKF